MSSQKGKIFVNTSFDLKILKIVVKRNWYWCLLFSMLLVLTAFLYLRYTKPVYESNMLIQLNSENQGADVLDFKDARKDASIAKEIELLRSQMLFEKAVSDLPLSVSLYAKGEFLTESLYRQGAIHISVKELKDESITGKPIYMSSDEGKIVIQFKHNENDYRYKFESGALLKTPFFSIQIEIDNWKAFQDNSLNNKLYFEFNNIKRIAQRLKSGLMVTPVDPNARTVQISYQSHSQALAQDITEALVQNFFKYDENIKKESADNVLEFITSQLDSLTQELRTSKDSIMLYQRQENITNPEMLTTSTAQKIEALKIEEKKNLDELRVLKEVERKIEGNPNSLDVYRLIPIIIGQSYESSLNQQIRDLYQLIEEKEDLLYQVTSQNEKIKKLEQRIQVRKENIDEVVQLLTRRIQKKINVIQKDISDLENRYFELPEKQMELSRLRNIKELNEKYFSLLTDKKAVYSISNAGYASDNKILNDASVSNVPVSPKSGMIYGVALFFSFSVSIAFLLLRFLTFNEINQLSDLRSMIPKNVGVLGSIPLIKNSREHSTLLVDDFPKSMTSESFRMIRTNLSFVKKDIRTITVTSTVSGEGKTFLVINLAGILAMSGKKVLVIDLDLRRPVVHKALDANNEKGMSNLLAGLSTNSEVIQSTRISGFDFIPAGPIPPNPSELILNDRLDVLIEEFKKDYDMIIFDNPPVGLVSDGIQLLSKVDVPIYVFRSNYSKRNYVDKLHEIASLDELKNINVLLNGVDSKKSTYGYGNYYTER